MKKPYVSPQMEIIVIDETKNVMFASGDAVVNWGDDWDDDPYP